MIKPLIFKDKYDAISYCINCGEFICITKNLERYSSFMKVNVEIISRIFEFEIIRDRKDGSIRETIYYIYSRQTDEDMFFGWLKDVHPDIFTWLLFNPDWDI